MGNGHHKQQIVMESEPSQQQNVIEIDPLQKRNTMKSEPFQKQNAIESEPSQQENAMTSETSQQQNFALTAVGRYPLSRVNWSSPKNYAFIGAVVSPTDGMIYVAPQNAQRAARFNPATGVWEAFGDTFDLDGAKWIGVTVSNVDDCIYAIPASFTSVHRMLKIDPRNGTAKMIGDDLRQFIGDDIRKYNNSWPWNDAVAALDGCIYVIACSITTSVLRFDPRTSKITTLQLPEEVVREGRNNNYMSGILGPSGRFVFGIPCNASRVLCIDTESLTVQLIGDTFSSEWKWLDGGIGGDNCIYCIPRNHTHVLRIDPVAMATSLLPVLGADLSGNWAWNRGCAGTDGCVYGTPGHSKYVLRIDPFARSASIVGAPIPEKYRGRHLLGAVVDHTGDHIWFLPHHGELPMLRMSLPVVKERRQWLRVLMAIGAEDYTQPNAARVDPEVSQMVRFFQRMPGLLRLVGGIMSRFYTPLSASNFGSSHK